MAECLGEFQAGVRYLLTEPALAQPQPMAAPARPRPRRRLPMRRHAAGRPRGRMDARGGRSRCRRRVPAAHPWSPHPPSRCGGRRRAYGSAVLWGVSTESAAGRAAQRARPAQRVTHCLLSTAYWPPMLRYTADDWIRFLRLQPHPEGGHFAETYRAADQLPAGALGGRYGSPRACSTAIYFLLRGTEFSALHRLRSDELWHFHAGSPALIVMISPSGELSEVTIGPDPGREQALQVVVPAGTWFGATVIDPASVHPGGLHRGAGLLLRGLRAGRTGGAGGRLPAAPRHHRAADTRVSRAPTHSSSASRSTTVNSGAKAAITSASSSSITPLMISEPPGATAWPSRFAPRISRPPVRFAVTTSAGWAGSERKSATRRSMPVGHPVQSQVLARRLYRVRIVIHGDHRARTECAGHEGEDAGPGARVEHRLAGQVDVLQERGAEPRAGVVAGAEPHRRLDEDRDPRGAGLRAGGDPVAASPASRVQASAAVPTAARS